MSLSSETLRQRLARKGAWRRAQPKVISKPISERVSTFPARFEGLRDRLCAENPSLSIESIENMLFSLIHDYPFWFAQTKDADSKSQELRRDHDINHGLRQAAPLTEAQKGALARRKQEREDRDRRIEERVNEASSA